MAILRYALILFLVSLSSGVMALSNVVYKLHDNTGVTFPSAQAACSAYAAAISNGMYGDNRYTGAPNATETACIYTCNFGAYCSSTYPLYKVCSDGAPLVNGICADDCPAGKTKADGTCASECEGKSQAAPTYAWYKSAVGGSTVEGSYCDGSCMVGINPAPTGTSYNNGKEKLQRYEVVVTAAPCSVSNVPLNTGSAPTPPEPPKRPVCAANEGVLTSTSGTIACVPEGVPSAQKPVVYKAEDVTTYPDGSTKKRETTYTKDPVSQVQDSHVKESITPKPDGQPGAAGPPGVVDQKGTSSCTGAGCGSGGGAGGGTGTGTGTGTDPTAQKDLCEKNPSLDFCQNKLNREETQAKILEAQNKVKDSLSAENFDAKTHIPDEFSASENAKKAASDKVAHWGEEVGKFGSGEDPASGKYSAFSDAMESGWFEPLPVSGCSPFSSSIGPWTWNLDICPTAAKISEIGAYCMWIMLLFSGFALVTKEGK